MNLQIRPKLILRVLLLIISILLCAHVLGILSEFALGHNNVYGLIPLFDFDIENNIPTLYSSLSLLFASVLLWFIAKFRKSSEKPFILWFGLAIIFTCLSIDEAVCLHELLTEPLRNSLQLDGIFYYAWVIPYGIGVILIALVYFRFLLSLPNKIRQLFITAAATFVTGAMGMELLGGLFASKHGDQQLPYKLITTAEELLEMLGTAIFIYALLTYLVIERMSFSFRAEE